jgi:tripartite-type tricarboxylate transporter receptor subunit TctC
MKNLLAQQGLVAEGGAPEALTAQVRSDTAKWREVIGRVGITAAE